MDFWEWLGRFDILISVGTFACIAIATFLGRAPKAERPSSINPYRQERYIPVEELSGMARIRAELALLTIDPAGLLLHDIGGLLVWFALGAFVIWIGYVLQTTNTPQVRGLEMLNMLAIFGNLLLIILAAGFILIYLTRIIWKLKH
jgi:hypothetical protein